MLKNYFDRLCIFKWKGLEVIILIKLLNLVLLVLE